MLLMNHYFSFIAEYGHLLQNCFNYSVLLSLSVFNFVGDGCIEKEILSLHKFQHTILVEPCQEMTSQLKKKFANETNVSK